MKVVTSRHYKYLFGPVPSRRLGRSLGVDLTPFKTCSFDCICCQLGRATNKTVTRKEYVPVKEVIAESDEWLKTFDLRMDRMAANAMSVAQFLETHHAVSNVRYPGLGNV